MRDIRLKMWCDDGRPHNFELQFDGVPIARQATGLAPIFAGESEITVVLDRIPGHSGPLRFRRFVLRRLKDHTGASGTGLVVEGVQFSDGRVALRWCTELPSSTVSWDSAEDVMIVHGHDGDTVFEWIDQ